ncbi:MAG TPA: hypothetical protein VL361_19200 [Candidatus Limnocylindrales bacterium]|jgi:hypothetical protein|nr:hypothetical protein [Candidatus Limnocylindrales bacterium]
MKTSSFLVALAVLAATAISLQASDKTTDSKKSKATVKKKTDSYPGPYKEKGVVLTGSYIKRDVKRQGTVTDGPNPVYVLDSKAIELTGAADLSQVLVRSGFRR